MTKKIITFLLAAAVFGGLFAFYSPDIFAAPSAPQECLGFGPFKCSNNSAGGLGQAVGTIFNIIFILGSLITLFFAIQGGLNYIQSSGDPKHVEAARNKITYALIGFVLLVAIYTLYVVVVVDILHIATRSPNGWFIFRIPTFKN